MVIALRLYADLVAATVLLVFISPVPLHPVSGQLLSLQQDGKTITSPAQIQRYTAQMLNDISTGLDKIETASENGRRCHATL
jgi:hypothetical protein